MTEIRCVQGKTINGHEFVVAFDDSDVSNLETLHPGVPVFSPMEIHHLQGMSREDSEIILLAKKELAGIIMGTLPIRKRRFRNGNSKKNARN